MIYLLSDQYFTDEDLATLGLSRMKVKRSKFRLSYVSDNHANFQDVMNYATRTYHYRLRDHLYFNKEVSLYNQCHLTILKEDVPLDFFLLINPARVRAALKFDTANVLTDKQQTLLDECKRLRSELPTAHDDTLNTSYNKKGDITDLNWEVDNIKEIEECLKTFRKVGEELLVKDVAMLKATNDLHNSLDWIISPVLATVAERHFSSGFSTYIK